MLNPPALRADTAQRSGLPWDRHLQNRWNDRVGGFVLKDFKNKNDMYRNFVAQHGYEPIGSEHRASEIFDFVSMLKMRSIWYTKKSPSFLL